MPRRTLYGAMMVTIAGVVLLSMSSATAGAWMARITGSMTTMKPVSQTVVSAAPRDAGGQEAHGAQGMSIRLVIGWVMLGLLLGMVIRGVLLRLQPGYRVLRQRQCRARRKRDIDRLTEQFQALFRQIDQEKHQRP